MIHEYAIINIFLKNVINFIIIENDLELNIIHVLILNLFLRIVFSK